MISFPRFGKRSSFLALILFLALSFAFDVFGVAPRGWFKTFQQDSEALIVGRLVPETEGGMFAQGGFPRRVISADGADVTYRHYLEGAAPLPPERFSVYFGQVGVQGNFFALVDKILKTAGLSPGTRLKILQTATAAALAIVIGWIVWMFSIEFGRGGALAAYLLMFLSPWLTVFARNLYWVPFTWFLPIALTWHFYVTHPAKRAFDPISTAACGTALALKALCGFEYVSDIAGTMATIVLYGSLGAGVSFRRLIWNSVSLIVAGVTAIGSSIGLQILCLGVYLGSFSAATNDFFFRISKRTYGDPSQFGELYALSLKANPFDVLLQYFSGSPILRVPRVEAGWIVIPLFIALLAGSIFLLKNGKDEAARWTGARLLLLVFGSFISSVSWHILAKGHSQVHTHMNYVLWHLPFMLLAGPIAVHLCKRLCQNLQVKRFSWPLQN